MFKVLASNGFKRIDPKEFNLTRIRSKGCILKVDLEYSKEFRQFQGDYALAPDKINVKREMLSNYQLNDC